MMKGIETKSVAIKEECLDICTDLKAIRYFYSETAAAG